MQVKSRTMSVQLEGRSLGSIPPINHMVVDKVGLYAYPLQDNTWHGGHASDAPQASFHNAVIVGVQSRRRTKVISVQTPYRLLNCSPLPLQFKVRPRSLHARHPHA
jgi:hypothetical protein